MGLLAYGLVALAIIAGLGGLYGTIHHSGVAEGRAEVEARWEAANKLAATQAAQRRDEASKTAQAAADSLAAAQQKATDYAALWRKARAQATRPLAMCPETPQSDPGKPSGNPEPRFSYRFVSLWDSAWTGPGGEPVLPDPAPPTGLGPDAPSAVGPGEVLDNHQANAEACSRDRRALDSLIGQVEKLRAGWR